MKHTRTHTHMHRESCSVVCAHLSYPLRGGGVIINLSSACSVRPTPFFTVPGAAKVTYSKISALNFYHLIIYSLHASYRYLLPTSLVPFNMSMLRKESLYRYEILVNIVNALYNFLTPFFLVIDRCTRLVCEAILCCYCKY